MSKINQRFRITLPNALVEVKTTNINGKKRERKSVGSSHKRKIKAVDVAPEQIHESFHCHLYFLHNPACGVQDDTIYMKTVRRNIRIGKLIAVLNS